MIILDLIIFMIFWNSILGASFCLFHLKFGLKYLLLSTSIFVELFPLSTLTFMAHTVISKKRSEKKLKKVVEELKKYGIFTDSIRLQKAKINSVPLKIIQEKTGKVKIITKDTTIFMDRQEQLKALYQVRHMMTGKMNHYSLNDPKMTTILKLIPDLLAEQKMSTRTNVILESEKAKKLLLQMEAKK